MLFCDYLIICSLDIDTQTFPKDEQVVLYPSLSIFQHPMFRFYEHQEPIETIYQ
jgi:hypothetical protein